MGHRKDKTRQENPTNNEQAHRHPAKAADYKGEAQNVNDDEGRPLNDEELEQASNKANESKSRREEKQ
jgi:hypothetical protein